MIVADQHIVNRGQLVETQTGRTGSPQAEARHGCQAITKNRIGQNIPLTMLDQESGVANPGHLYLFGIRFVNGFQVGFNREPFFPGDAGQIRLVFFARREFQFPT